MARRLRIDLAGYPLHVVQRGNNRTACFFSDTDRRSYLTWLGQYADLFGVRIHAWVLMTNHVHLLSSCEATPSVSRMMQALGRQYVGYVNRATGRTGTLWEGRFKACAIDSGRYLLDCMRYIELNPVRAGIVPRPEDFPWSSYRHNALGMPSGLVTEHEVYASLGPTPEEQRRAYLHGFPSEPDEAFLDLIRAATSSGHLLSDDRKQMPEFVRRGRPRIPRPPGFIPKN